MSTLTVHSTRVDKPPVSVAGMRARSEGFPFRGFLVAIFVLSLPIVNPWVRGDGVGYYAFARAILIGHNLNFAPDWLSANPSFRQGRVDAEGHLLPSQYTRTGHLDNHFTIGPAILWAPFLSLVHGTVLLANSLGARIAPDGFSRPYIVTIALATASYGFAGLVLAFGLARRYVHERWAFLATLAIWLGSSLPVYMYFNPSWSHALSAFAVSLFLWYWHRTRTDRSLAQWLVLAAMAGLMMNIYYPNVIVLLVPGVEALFEYFRILRRDSGRQLWPLFRDHVAFGGFTLVLLAPTFITRRIIYGNALATGYPPMTTWAWTSPKLFAVLFSAEHGMLSWTPVLAFAIAGLFLFLRHDRVFGAGLLLTFLAFYYFIASYPDWAGLSSFGNRFFVSLTALFIIGLSAAFETFAKAWKGSGGEFAAASLVVCFLILWNFAFIFQWGTQMIPARGPISWTEMIHNQYAEVPRRVTAGLDSYFLRRKGMMQEIETRDLRRTTPHAVDRAETR